MSFEIGETINGKFRIDEIIPTGSSTRVFVAWDLSLDRRVVVKALNDDVAGDVIFAERFAREARMAGRLKHPHIVKVFENGTYNGVPYFVTEFVPGATLASLMNSQPGNEQLPWPEANAILAQIGDALDYAHTQGLVHRDVKPSNMIVEMRTEGPEATLIDFGITKNLDASQPWTMTTGFLGTAEYASPEQIQGSADIDGRSDVYSFGCTAFAVLTGVSPYADARDDVARIAAHLQAPVPSASKINPSLPRGVDAVFQTALAKNRIHRFATCTEFVTALQAQLSQGTVPYRGRGALASPAGDSTDSEPSGRRTPRWAWAIVAAAALLVIGIGVLLLGRSDGSISANTTTTAVAPATTPAPTTSTTTTTTTTTIATVPVTAPPPTEPPPPPAPPTNPYGYVVGAPVPNDGSPVGAALTSLTTRSPQATGISSDSPLAWYQAWLRHVSPSPTDAAIATEEGASFQADVPVTLKGFEVGPDGGVASAQECAATCQSLTEKIPIRPPCSVNPGCDRWQSTTGKATFTLRATVYVRYPSVTELFMTQSSQPIVSVSDPAGTTSFDPETGTFALRLDEEPVPGTVLLVNITYADGTSDQLTITF